MSGELWTRGLADLADGVRAREVAATDVARAFLDRVEAHDDGLNCFLRVDGEAVMESAATVDRALAAGDDPGPLAGVPIALKDNLCTRGVETTCGSRMLAGWVPPYDAHVVQRLRSAGAVLLGKTNMDEFAMGSSSESSAAGPVKNPWDPTRVPGGSSGGSAAAVAASMCAGALGSDTGGSVRQPAALCGVTALKPTYGRVSRYGLVAFASSLDQIGPIGRSARDAARLLSVCAGPDARDATCSVRGTDDYEAQCGAEVRGLRVGVLADAVAAIEDPAVRAGVRAAVDALRGLGCETVDVTLPHAKHAVSVYYLVATAEASSNLARFDGVRYGLRVDAEDVASMHAATRAAGFGPEVKRRILLGTYALSAGYYDAYYLKASRVRTLVARDFTEAFERCDVVVGPTSPTTAFPLGERVDDPLSMYLADVFTVPPSLAGLPSMSVPCGLADGLPVGLQLTAPAFEEGRLVRVADAFERATPHAGLRPPLG